MKRIFLILFIFSINFLNAKIIEIKSIKEVLNYLDLSSKKTLFVFDIDNTVFESVEKNSIGSDQWFDGCINWFFNKTKCWRKTYGIVIPAYLKIIRRARFDFVEKEWTKYLFCILKENKISILGLTLRSVVLGDVTYNLFKNKDITLTFESLSKDAIELSDIQKEYMGSFFKGIVFCKGRNKGLCLDAFKYKFNDALKNIETIVMIDDKRNPLKEVEEVFEQQGIEFIGLRYGHLDEKVKRFIFDPNTHITDFA